MPGFTGSYVQTQVSHDETLGGDGTGTSPVNSAGFVLRPQSKSKGPIASYLMTGEESYAA